MVLAEKKKMMAYQQKGILLAGGLGTRLYPLTQSVSKQLLPIYDKPTIYYPLSTLMLANVRDILIISTPRDTPAIEKLLGNGSLFGLRLTYEIQENPNGIADAFRIGENFIGDSPVWLILGDNIFYGNSITQNLDRARKSGKGCSLFCYRVNDPENYGVLELSDSGVPIGLEEKPSSPKSNWATTGLYYYGPGVSKMARLLKPSKRGELEITDLNKMYLKNNDVHIEFFGRGYAWLDSGSFDSLLSASQFVQTIEKRQGLKIACIEEIAFILGWIDRAALETRVRSLGASPYGKYLIQVLNSIPN